MSEPSKVILLDPRAGSCELLKPLKAAGLPVEESTLDFGDLAFLGRGEQGTPLFIGVEHKKLADLLQSMETGRLQGHQLLGMLTTFDRRYLVVEGEWDHDERGRVSVVRERGQRRPMRGAPPALALEQRLINLETRGGLPYKICANRRATVRFISALYRYWTDKDLDQHKSHLAMYCPDLDRGVFNPPTDFRKALSVLLPDVHTAVSRAIEEAVGGPTTKNRVKLQRLLAWSAEQWADLQVVTEKGKPRRLGESRAKRIMEALD